MTIKESKPLDRMFFDRPSDLEKQAALFLKQGLEAEKKRDFEAAVIAYKQAMALNPTHKEIWYFIHNNLGYSLNQIGEFEEGENIAAWLFRLIPISRMLTKTWDLPWLVRTKMLTLLKAM